jgi:hypothetical protein
MVQLSVHPSVSEIERQARLLPNSVVFATLAKMKQESIIPEEKEKKNKNCALFSTLSVYSEQFCSFPPHLQLVPLRLIRLPLHLLRLVVLALLPQSVLQME